jgi:hypothetical protein
MERGLIELGLDLSLGEDADTAELNQAGRQLRAELLDLDVEDVRLRRAQAPPKGARAGEAVALGGLLTTMAPQAIGQVLDALLNWVSRHSQRSLRLELDGDVLELSNASADEQRRAAEAFFVRHGAATE